jgi:tetratricopeptide (TPR) repeat protein
VRGRRAVILIGVVSGLLSVLLAVAVNVATGGSLPAPVDRFAWLAWPMVGLLGVLGAGLAIWQYWTADRPGDAPPPAVRRPPAELPPAPATFAGRVADLDAIERLVASGRRVVALVGAPGAGKSTLAVRVAYRHAPAFPDGQLYAALRGATADPADPATVLARFLGVLGVPEDERVGDVDALAARYRSTLVERRVLVLLDDARDAAQVTPLLPAGTGCLVLITSRRHLAELPGAEPLRVGGLDPADALAVLTLAAGADRLAADPEGARRIVRSCAGLPLALGIAGARLRARPGWTPTDLATRLDDERRRLDELRQGDLAVRSSFDASYRELPATDRQVFRWAGAHPGEVFGAGAVAALAGLPEPATEAALDRLVDAHLVEAPAPDRYRIHDLLRLFAAELRGGEPSGAALERLVDWLVRTARPGDWLTRERENVVAVARHAVDAGADEPAWTLVSAVHALLVEAGDNHFRLALWREGAAAAEALDDDWRRVRALRWVAAGCRNAGEVTAALAPAEQALTIARRLGDPRELAQSLRAYGEVMRDLSRFAEAEDHLGQALDRYAELGDPLAELEVRSALGTLYNTYRMPDRALPVLERAEALLPAREGVYHGWVFLGLSIAYKLSDRHDDAVGYAGRAMDVAARIHDEFLRGYALQERAYLAAEEGRLDDATAAAREMLGVFELIRHGSGVGTAWTVLGDLAELAGRLDTALDAYDRAIAQFDRLLDEARSGQTRLRRAEVLERLGRPGTVGDREGE